MKPGKIPAPFEALRPEGEQDLESALRIKESMSERYRSMIVREAERFANVMAGLHPDDAMRRLDPDTRVRYIKEAMSSADFGTMFTNVMDREILPRFRMAQRTMGKIFRFRPVNDFRAVERYRREGGGARLPVIPDQGEYLSDKLTKTAFTYSLQKYGKLFNLTLKAIIDDDLGFFSDLPDDLVNSAIATDEYNMTNLFFTTTGPRTTVFEGQGGQTTLATTALNATNLKAALGEMLAYVTPTDSQPLAIRPKYLIVPPALEMTAFEILRSVMFAPGGSTGNERFTTYNAFQNLNLEVVTNPWIPLIATSGTIKNTTWMLACAPEVLPAGEWGFLRGYREPQIFVRQDSAGQGGGRDPFGVDFTHDVKSMKVRHFAGGMVLEGRAIWGSFGQ